MAMLLKHSMATRTQVCLDLPRDWASLSPNWPGESIIFNVLGIRAAFSFVLYKSWNLKYILEVLWSNLNIHKTTKQILGMFVLISILFMPKGMKFALVEFRIIFKKLEELIFRLNRIEGLKITLTHSLHLSWVFLCWIIKENKFIRNWFPSFLKISQCKVW